MANNNRELCLANMLASKAGRKANLTESIEKLAKKRSVLAKYKVGGEEVKRIGSEIQRLTSDRDLIDQTAEKLLLQVEAMPEVAAVTYEDDGNTVAIETKPMTMVIGRKKVDIGTYLIQVHLGGMLEVRIYRADGIRFKNYSSHHPFINSEGVPCFGVWQPTISKALIRGAVYTIAVAAIQLLKCNHTKDRFYINPHEFRKELELARGRKIENDDDGE